MNFPSETENPLDVLRSVQADLHQFQLDMAQGKTVSMLRTQDDAEMASSNKVESMRPATNVPMQNAAPLVLGPKETGSASSEPQAPTDPPPRGEMAYYILCFVAHASSTHTVYVKDMTTGEVCYYSNRAIVGGKLTYSGVVDPAVRVMACSYGNGTEYVANFAGAGTYFNEPRDFKCWKNTVLACVPDHTGDAFYDGHVVVSNTGQVPIDVNGTVIPVGGADFALTPIADVGYGTGDKSAYAGGTLISVTEA